jgi:hypothetical protein
MTFRGDKFEVSIDGKVVQAGTLKLDPNKNPQIVDVIVTEGEGKGMTLTGIYKVSGDDLQFCHDLRGKARPTDFKAPSGSGCLLLVMKKEAIPEAEKLFRPMEKKVATSKALQLQLQSINRSLPQLRSLACQWKERRIRNCTSSSTRKNLHPFENPIDPSQICPMLVAWGLFESTIKGLAF